MADLDVIEQPILGESSQPPDAAAEAARTKQLEALDAAPDMAAYKKLRQEGKDEAAKADETPAEAAQRARDEKGRFALKADEPPAKTAKPRDDPQARKSSIQADIDAAVKARAEAQRELAEIRAEAARLKAERDAPKQEQTSSADDFEPWDQWAGKNPDKSYEHYLRAAWKHDLAMELKARSDAQERSAAEQRIGALQSTHEERIAAARAIHPDWDEHAANVAGIQPSQTLYAAVVTSERSHDLTYYLMTHPQEYAQLAQRTAALPVAAADWVRDYLEAKIGDTAATSSGPAVPTRQSRANPPPKPVGGSPSVASVDPEDMPIDDYRRNWLARQKAKRGG